jgi:hypothetical protein
VLVYRTSIARTTPDDAVRHIVSIVESRTTVSELHRRVHPGPREVHGGGLICRVAEGHVLSRSPWSSKPTPRPPSGRPRMPVERSCCTHQPSTDAARGAAWPRQSTPRPRRPAPANRGHRRRGAPILCGADPPQSTHESTISSVLRPPGRVGRHRGRSGRFGAAVRSGRGPSTPPGRDGGSTPGSWLPRRPRSPRRWAASDHRQQERRVGDRHLGQGVWAASLTG